MQHIDLLLLCMSLRIEYSEEKRWDEDFVNVGFQRLMHLPLTTIPSGDIIIIALYFEPRKNITVASTISTPVIFGAFLPPFHHFPTSTARLPHHFACHPGPVPLPQPTIFDATTSTMAENKTLPNDGPSVTLTIRLIMQGKEVGSIIGKKGDNIKKFREESGAKINISDGSCPERIVTVTGPTDAIFKAFNLICKKFEENNPNSGTVPKPPITLRLIVPASQCGSLIGKGGSKIKEIREVTGASIQVASEMLPSSTERAVTLSGTSESITQCIYHICCVMMESPPKGATIPYRPKPAMPPVIFAGGQAYTIQGQYAIPHPDGDPTSYLQLTKLHQLALQHHPILPAHNMSTTGLNPQALAAMAASNHLGRPGTLPAQTQTHEMTIPNDLIGCIIGKGGSKINEIRQLSGATIKISNSEEGSKDRAVTITGVPEAISMAQYLINTSINQELAKSLKF
ncbi:Poly(rC)-binding protein 3 [Chamberlinius hualienensis]